MSFKVRVFTLHRKPSSSLCKASFEVYLKIYLHWWPRARLSWPQNQFTPYTAYPSPQKLSSPSLTGQDSPHSLFVQYRSAKIILLLKPVTKKKQTCGLTRSAESPRALSSQHWDKEGNPVPTECQKSQTWPVADFYLPLKLLGQQSSTVCASPPREVGFVGAGLADPAVPQS